MRLGYRLDFLEVVEGEPFPPQVVEVVEVVEAEEVLLRLLDLMEEVSVQSFFTPN